MALRTDVGFSVVARVGANVMGCCDSMVGRAPDTCIDMALGTSPNSVAIVVRRATDAGQERGVRACMACVAVMAIGRVPPKTEVRHP